MVSTSAGSIPRCPPGEHVLPDSVRPGQPTKCRRCRASVRVPKAAVVLAADHEIAMVPPGAELIREHEEFKAKARTFAGQQRDRIASLEARIRELEEQVARLESELETAVRDQPVREITYEPFYELSPQPVSADNSLIVSSPSVLIAVPAVGELTSSGPFTD